MEQVRIDRGVTEVALEVNSQRGPLALSAGQARTVGVKAGEGQSPMVSYKREGTDAKLGVKSEGPLSLELPRGVIFDFDIEQVNGPMTLQLDGLRVRELEVENGQEATSIRADGPLSDLETVGIEQIGGAIDLTFGGAAPELSDLEIQARGAAVKLELGGGYVRLGQVEVEGSSAPVEAVLSGAFAKLEKVQIETTTGPVTVDLSGLWTGDSTISVETTDGPCVLTLPPKVGVIVYPSTGSGKIDLGGLSELKREENRELNKSYRRMAVAGESTDAYVNAAYGKVPVTLTLDINTTTGDIAVQ